MELFEAIKERRSIRKYKDKKIEEDKILDLINAGITAPSASDRQPWHFVVIEDPDTIGKLSERAKKRFKEEGMHEKYPYIVDTDKDTIFFEAPLLIILTAPRENKWRHVDCGIAAENMMLAAYGLGLGSCYIGFACLLDEEEKTRKELEIPEDHEIVAPLVFGYPDQQIEKPEREAKILKWIKDGR